MLVSATRVQEAGINILGPYLSKRVRGFVMLHSSGGYTDSSNSLTTTYNLLNTTISVHHSAHIKVSKVRHGAFTPANQLAGVWFGAMGIFLRQSSWNGWLHHWRGGGWGEGAVNCLQLFTNRKSLGGKFQATNWILLSALASRAATWNYRQLLDDFLYS